MYYSILCICPIINCAEAVVHHYSDNTNPAFDSDSGTFLGLGTVTGSVAVYITFSLQVKTVWRYSLDQFEKPTL